MAFLLILQIFWWETSYSDDLGSQKLNEEILRQEEIYRSQGEHVPEGYVIDRSLLSYTNALSPEFDRSLANLGPKDRWLDIGAGRGQAILDYYAQRYDGVRLEGQERPAKKARAVAMSIEDRRTPLWQQKAASLEPNQIQYLFNRRLREYSLAELGQFKVISDVMGGFSYTTDLSIFMEKVLSFLELDGTFFTILQDVHSEAGTNRPYYANSPFLTEIANADGSEVKVCSWLKNITCVNVSCEFKADWKPPIEVFRIHKVCNEVTVPALLPLKYEAGTPPERRFQVKK
jgi:SAM-dependent methyltransferase